jgi:hypothetical protein
MKYKNKKRKLKVRIEDYNRMIASNKDYKGYHKPGKIK